MPDIYDLNTSCFVANWPLGGTLTINNYTNSQGTNTQSSITEISNFSNLASTPLLFLYGGESTPIPVEIAGGEIGTINQIANFSDLETITQPVSYGGGTNPVPVNVINPGSVVEISNIEFGAGTITALTPRIVLADPTQSLTGAAFATPYSALSISGSAATNTNLQEVNLSGFDGDKIAIEVDITTHASTPPGASTYVMAKFYPSTISGLTAINIKNNNPIFSRTCNLENAANTRSISSGFFSMVGFPYLYILLDYTTMAAAISLTLRIRKYQLINLYA